MDKAAAIVILAFAVYGLLCWLADWARAIRQIINDWKTHDR